jgi:hypothetical protein
MGLKWSNMDLVDKRLTVCEQISGTTEAGGGTLKEGDEREVDMRMLSSRSCAISRRSSARRRFHHGNPIPTYALFPCFDESTDRKAEQRVVKVIRCRTQRVLRLAGARRIACATPSRPS